MYLKVDLDLAAVITHIALIDLMIIAANELSQGAFTLTRSSKTNMYSSKTDMYRSKTNMHKLSTQILYINSWYCN